MKTVFLASGNHFLPFSQTAVNCCQCKQFFPQLEHNFQQILHSVGGNGFSVLRKQCFLIRAIFLLMEAIIGIMRKTVFKERAYYCQWATDFVASENHFFLYFLETSASESFVFPTSESDVSRKSLIPSGRNGCQRQMVSARRKKNCK